VGCFLPLLFFSLCQSVGLRARPKVGRADTPLVPAQRWLAPLIIVCHDVDTDQEKRLGTRANAIYFFFFFGTRLHARTASPRLSSRAPGVSMDSGSRAMPICGFEWHGKPVRFGVSASGPGAQIWMKSRARMRAADNHQPILRGQIASRKDHPAGHFEALRAAGPRAPRR